MKVEIGSFYCNTCERQNALEVERHEGETPWQLYLSTECGHDQIGCIDLTGKDRKQLIKLLQGG